MQWPHMAPAAVSMAQLTPPMIQAAISVTIPPASSFAAGSLGYQGVQGLQGISGYQGVQGISGVEEIGPREWSPRTGKCSCRKEKHG